MRMWVNMAPKTRVRVRPHDTQGQQDNQRPSYKHPHKAPIILASLQVFIPKGDIRDLKLHDLLSLELIRNKLNVLNAAYICLKHR